MNYILETERLRLRELERTDASFIIELVNTPGWLEFIGDRNVKNIESAVAYIENGPLKSYADNGFGLWLAELKESKILIGMCGILKRDTLENPDIGFAFMPEFTGKGYACEVAQATLNHAKGTLNIDKLVAIVVPTNKRSIHLLEKIGFKFVKLISDPRNNTELMFFSN